MIEVREPYRRGKRPEDGMDLPDGKTCGDCVHCRRCTLMFGHIPADEVCDWFPSRFTPPRQSEAADLKGGC
ncbi:hypothetical protein [Pseudomonas sp. 9Ag]|uniref:hypothetical protein n=1 Tax=Pseudomonas sp. 9Ag TaxID=2653167 RepID=UPI001357D614|nr:hypothetical protein [Pseudomonas sp. 9Ag]